MSQIKSGHPESKLSQYCVSLNLASQLHILKT